MPCYICSHCNKCGMYSTKLDLSCATCGNPIVPGTKTCPVCGNAYLYNMNSGDLKRPEGAASFYTKPKERVKGKPPIKKIPGQEQEREP